MTMLSALQTMQRPSLTLHITKKEPYRRGGTRFGGQPDVPLGFVWPVFTGTDDSGEPETRPLSFLANLTARGWRRTIAVTCCPARGFSLSFTKPACSHGALTLMMQAAPGFFGFPMQRYWIRLLSRPVCRRRRGSPCGTSR